ncbi:HNH endonuclease [Acinetobacter pittii]|uniref:HNH endonuclease n=1 Tax=Acinetobacter pittii TaxID=48296 RepID=UPI00094CB11B|nr:HNH endonuclease [Acinetobacter pittii]
MNINYKSIFPKLNLHYDFNKCIICLDPHDNDNPNKKLTDEHIVPEFIGGKIVIKNVCKECNSTLGYALEGPLSNNIYFKSYAYANKIKGKKGKLTNPLAGEYTYNGVRFRFESDFSLYQLPIINPLPTTDGGFELGVSIDVKDLKTIENDIFKAVSRKLKKQGKSLKENKLREDIRKVIEHSKSNIKVINQPELQVTFSLDFDQIALLALKIVYEIIAWLLGEDIISLDQFDLIRNSLKTLKLHPKIIYTNEDFYKNFRKFLVENPYYKTNNLAYIDDIFKENKTIVVFIKGYCSIRLLNLWYSFKMPEYLKDAFLFFTSDSKTGEVDFFQEDILVSPEQ